MDQLSFFEGINYWIPEIDNGCRMWKCPGCKGRMIGHSMHGSLKNFNPYKFCPYCGLKLYNISNAEIESIDCKYNYFDYAL